MVFFFLHEKTVFLRSVSIARRASYLASTCGPGGVCAPTHTDLSLHPPPAQRPGVTWGEGGHRASDRGLTLAPVHSLTPSSSSGLTVSSKAALGSAASSLGSMLGALQTSSLLASPVAAMTASPLGGNWPWLADTLLGPLPRSLLLVRDKETPQLMMKKKDGWVFSNASPVTRLSIRH